MLGSLNLVLVHNVDVHFVMDDSVVAITGVNVFCQWR